MANYTIELRHLIAAGYVPSLTTYPIYLENYRAILNQKIKDHYWFSEIGLETPDRFDWYLKTRMNEIMPLFNKLYQSELLTFNPLFNYNLTETTTKENTGTNVATTSSNDTSKNTMNRGAVKNVNAESDTPQGMLNPFDIEAGGFASKVTINQNTPEADVTDITASTAITNAGEVAAVEEFAKTVSGFSGVIPAEMLMRYRDSLLNIDMQIINSLADLFMGVY